MLTILKELQQQRVISAGDYYFAKLIADKQPVTIPLEVQNLAILLAALCRYNYQQGHTCLLLEPGVEQHFFNLAYRTTERHYLEKIQAKIGDLSPEKWQTALAEHHAFTTRPFEKVAPFVFQFKALYFYRIWQDEYRVAEYLKDQVQLSQTANFSTPFTSIQTVLAKYFPLLQQDDVNWQKVAVATALRQHFCLITGGPGTGKTTTVARLLLALQELHQRQLRIKLVAPTGKAAARLTESIHSALKNLQERENIQIDDELRQTIPMVAQTLHRLLGIRLFEDSTIFNSKNRLSIDVLVVDEASMIDLPLMAKLLQALKPQTKLILLGDENQLSPVEVGETLGEIGQFAQGDYSVALTQYLQTVAGISLPAAERVHPLRDHLCRLYHSHRFSSHSGIGQLARAINQGEYAASWQCFSQYPDLTLIDFSMLASLRTGNPETYVQACVALVVKSAVEKYADYLLAIKQMQQVGQPLTEQQVSTIFTLFNSVRFLTALRVGELGVEQLNHKIAQRLQQKGLVQFKHERDWYLGKPVMITQNDSHVGLYNGDIGLFLGDGKVWFEQGQQHYKTVLASRVPSYEPAFVMTVHKSQGSEFAHTCLVLPIEPNPILSRELIYTGITRAKAKLTLFTTPESWKTAVKHPVKRQSGLAKWLIALFNTSD